MKTLHMMVGLPRSGKSTKSKELRHPVVEPDAIRTVIHGTPFKANIEPLIWATAKIMVQSLFEAGHDDVILDAVNHTVARRREWENKDWRIEFHVINTAPDICIDRAIEAKQDYLIPIIERMARDYQPIGGSTDC